MKKSIRVRIKYSLFFSLFVLVQSLSAQKEFKPIKSFLKSGKPAEALAEIAKLAVDSNWADDPRLYVLGVEANEQIHATQNEKAYLKQPMDTAAFFSSTFGVCDYALRTDSADMMQATHKGKAKYRTKSASWVASYYPNLEAGLTYYYKHKNYAETERFTALCLKLSESDLWNSVSTASTIPRSRLAMRYAQSCYLQQKYAEVIAMRDLALTDTLHRRLTLEYIALSYRQLGDKENYESTLREAIAEYPNYSPFFSYLLEILLEENRNEAALALCDTLIASTRPGKELLYGRCLSLLALGRWENLITAAEDVLALDAEERMADYFIGLAYCNLASAVRLPTSITSKTYKEAQAVQRQYYKSALPRLERYREGCPDDKARWAPLLYHVYLALNMGKKFEEIQNYM